MLVSQANLQGVIQQAWYIGCSFKGLFHMMEVMVWSNEEAKRLAVALKAARIERGFSQEKLAFGAGIKKNQMQLLEAGRASGRKGETGCSNPQMATIYGLAKALDLTVAELFERAGL